MVMEVLIDAWAPAVNRLYQSGDGGHALVDQRLSLSMLWCLILMYVMMAAMAVMMLMKRQSK